MRQWAEGRQLSSGMGKEDTVLLFFRSNEGFLSGKGVEFGVAPENLALVMQYSPIQPCIIVLLCYRS